MIKVLVLMSTWNGECFLKAQLDSIFAQSFDGQIHLLVRDDGSNDRTLNLLDSYLGTAITIVRGRNIGAKASFLELMRLAVDFDADYYALSDQDDVWCPNKIAVAVNCIKHLSSPALYCSSVELVNKDLSHLSNYIHPGDHSFESTLLSNYVTGCTSVFNRMLLKKIRFPVDSSHIIMHDWWLGLTAASYGDVFYDSISHIKYRQHGNNHVGMVMGLRGLIRRFKSCFYPKRVASRVTQAKLFENTYCGDLSDLTRSALSSFIKYSGTAFGRLKYVYLIRSHVGLVTAVRYVLFS